MILEKSSDGGKMNNIYAIIDSKTGAIVAKTHYLCLKNDVEAVYSLVNFASMLNNRFVSLVCVGKQDPDNMCTIISLAKPRFLCDFLGVPDYLEEISELDKDIFYNTGLSKENISSAFSYALDNILIREEKLGIMRQLSGDLSSFDPKEIDKLRERLQHIDFKLNGGKINE